MLPLSHADEPAGSDLAMYIAVGFIAGLLLLIGYWLWKGRSRPGS